MVLAAPFGGLLAHFPLRHLTSPALPNNIVSHAPLHCSIEPTSELRSTAHLVPGYSPSHRIASLPPSSWPFSFDRPALVILCFCLQCNCTFRLAALCRPLAACVEGHLHFSYSGSINWPNSMHTPDRLVTAFTASHRQALVTSATQLCFLALTHTGAPHTSSTSPCCQIRIPTHAFPSLACLPPPTADACSLLHPLPSVTTAQSTHHEGVPCNPQLCGAWSYYSVYLATVYSLTSPLFMSLPLLILTLPTLPYLALHTVDLLACGSCSRLRTKVL
ncbi:hypothetical protein LIA77_11395 [Sarocladium implicatum]|nr:hypothetical protein LIA77_11395 [Sarocladium implicatum]